MKHHERRSAVHQALAGKWPRREIENALEALDEEALADFYGERPAEVVSAQIRASRRAADDEAHEAVAGKEARVLRRAAG